MNKVVMTKPKTELATHKVDPDEKMFVHFLGCAVQGLLAGNTAYDESQLGTGEVYKPEELIQNAWWYAEEMVKIVRNRREVERFEAKVKEAE